MSASCLSRPYRWRRQCPWAGSTPSRRRSCPLPRPAVPGSGHQCRTGRARPRIRRRGAGVGVSVRCFSMNVWSKGWCASGARLWRSEHRCRLGYVGRLGGRLRAWQGADLGVGRPRRAQGRHDVTTVLPASGRRRVTIRRFWCSWRTRALGRVETLRSAGGWLCSGRLGGRFDPARVGRFARVRGPCVGRGRFDAACAHFTVRDDEGKHSLIVAYFDVHALAGFRFSTRHLLGGSHSHGVRVGSRGTSMERPSRATSLPKTVRWCDAMVQFSSVVTASPRSTGVAQVGSPSVCGALGCPGCERGVSDSVRAIRVVVDDLTV